MKSVDISRQWKHRFFFSPLQLKLHHSSSVTHCDITRKKKLSRLCGLLTAVTNSWADAACVASPPRVVGGANLTTFLVSTIIPTGMTQLEDALGHVHRSLGGRKQPSDSKTSLNERKHYAKLPNKQTSYSCSSSRVKVERCQKLNGALFCTTCNVCAEPVYWLSNKNNWPEKSLPVVRGGVITIIQT